MRAACDRIGLLSCRCHLLTLMLVIVAWRLVTQRSTWVSIVFLAYGSLGVIYVRYEGSYHSLFCTHTSGWASRIDPQMLPIKPPTVPSLQGDIGTSLLYVYSTIFANINLADQSAEGVQDDVYGAISLIFWTLTLVAVVKYVLVVLRANDTGEGELNMHPPFAMHCPMHRPSPHAPSSPP